MALLSAVEAAECLGVTPSKLIRLQDSRIITPEVTPDGTFYESNKLIGVNPRTPTVFRRIRFPKELYATPEEAMSVLEISRGTFYAKVRLGQIKVVKQGRLTFVLRKDLYANDDLF